MNRNIKPIIDIKKYSMKLLKPIIISYSLILKVIQSNKYGTISIV